MTSPQFQELSCRQDKKLSLLGGEHSDSLGWGRAQNEAGQPGQLRPLPAVQDEHVVLLGLMELEQAVDPRETLQRGHCD